MAPATGLRERKKQKTRDAIVRAALRLFERRGYDATTITDIAAAANIAPRTFFAYFPSKEAVVFHDVDAEFERLAERLRGRPAGETVFDALRAWIRDWLGEPERSSAHEQRRRQLIHSTPSLRDHDRAHLARVGELVREGVATDLGVAADSLRARLVTAAAIAALDEMRSLEEHPEPDRALALLDEALAFLQGGLEALRKRPA
jgi:AcrR family transcriptional regulator